MNLSGGRWSLIGSQSTDFESAIGMTGNYQIGGRCLELNIFPDLPYYTQYYRIEYWHPDVGQVVSKKFELWDCDGDDRTCEEYHSVSALNQESDNFTYSKAIEIHTGEKELLNRPPEEKNLKLIIYDLMGSKLDVSGDDKLLHSLPRNQIVLFTYWNAHGELITSKKVLVQ